MKISRRLFPMNRKIAIMTCNAGCQHKLIAEPGEQFFTTIGGEVYVLRHAPSSANDEFLIELTPYRPERHLGYVTETNW